MRIKDLFKKEDGKTSTEKAEEKKFEGRQRYSRAYKTSEISLAKQQAKSENLKEKNFKVSELGAMTFKTTIFKDELRTPHYEMQKSLENYEEVPNINAAINQIVLFITGNNIKIISEDEYTQKWYSKWLEQRPHTYTSLTDLILLCEVCGNAYIEPVWSKTKSEDIYMNDFKVVPDSTRVYYNLTQEEVDKEFWIFQVPYIFRKFEDMDIKVFRISYIKNGIAWQETVYGIPLKETDLIHFKMGHSRYGYYGRSYLASTIDDTEILTQLLKNYAIASRYMAMGKKLISVDDDGDIMPLEELKKITDIINSPEDEESITINRKVKVNDMAPTSFNEMSGPLEYVRKDLSSGMTPNFMTPWAEMVTYASSNNAKIPFELSLENKRQKYIEMLNRNILENVRKQNPKLKDATFEFGEVSMDDPIEANKNNIELYDNDLITLNQLLEKINLPTVDNGDIYKSKRNYIMQKKYELTQNDVEQFEEPYLKRSIQNDMKQPFQKFESFQESKDSEIEVVDALKFIETEKGFKKEFKKKYDLVIDKIESRNNIKGSDLVRLCAIKDYYIIVDNLEWAGKTYPDIAVARKSYNLTVEQVKLEYENFFVGDTDIEKLSEELFKDVKNIQWEITKQVFDEIKNTTVKENAFIKKKVFKEKNVVNPGVLDKIDNLFGLFNTALQDRISKVVDKLTMKDKINIDINGTIDPMQTAKVAGAKDILKDLIFNQFKTFNQNQSQDIKRIVSNGILAGTPVSKVDQELKDTVIDWKKTKPSVNDYKILRITNTEIHKSAIQLKLLKWKQMGIKYVKYLAHMDDRVRPTHKKLNNKIFTIDDALKLEEWKEINCRCNFKPIIM